MDERQRRETRMVLATFGLLPALLGGVLMLYLRAFAGIVNPQLTAEARRAEILRKLFFSPSRAGTIAALVMIGAGLGVFASGFTRARWAVAIGVAAAILTSLLIAI